MVANNQIKISQLNTTSIDTLFSIDQLLITSQTNNPHFPSFIPKITYEKLLLIMDVYLKN